MKRTKFVVGIDEAGRGPLAGPLYLGGVSIPTRSQILKRKIKDSKQQTPQKREEWFKFLQKEKKLRKLIFATVSVSPKQIDTFGLSRTIAGAIKQVLLKLKINPRETTVLLDGGLQAPEKYKFQKTIIKGDEKFSVIALASIVAKVTRDKKMVSLGETYPLYKFHIHKGYGTLMHRNLIMKHGPSAIHRRSFLRNIILSKKIKAIKPKKSPIA